MLSYQEAIYSRAFSNSSRAFASFVKASEAMRQGEQDGGPKRNRTYGKASWVTIFRSNLNNNHQHYCNPATKLKLVDQQLVLMANEVSHPCNICHKENVRCR